MRGSFSAADQAETYVFVVPTRAATLAIVTMVEIIVDKDTFRAGQTAPVISRRSNDRTYSSALKLRIFSVQAHHRHRTAKLIELPIEEKHVPNIYLHALMVSDAELFQDAKQVVVPPVQQFLAVDVKADREQYQPREEGTLSITARDANGKPVSAEIALGLIDESVKYIQQDYAGDPRQFYYGTKRSQASNSKPFEQKSICVYWKSRGD